MTTCHHSSCRSCVCLCWWHQPSSPEEKGSQQSHVPTLRSWHVAPSGNITLQTQALECTNTFSQRHCQTAVEAGTWSRDNFHSKLHFSLYWANEPTDKWPAASVGDLHSYGMVMVRHLDSGEVKHHQRLRSSSRREWLQLGKMVRQAWLTVFVEAKPVSELFPREEHLGGITEEAHLQANKRVSNNKNWGTWWPFRGSPRKCG